MNRINRVAIIGTGTLGAQIALQAAHYRNVVSVYDRAEESFERVLAAIKMRIENSGRRPTIPVLSMVETAQKGEKCKSIEEAVSSADLVVEAIAESLEMKRSLFRIMDRNAPPEVILATNSSSIPVSKMEDATRALKDV